MTPDATSLSPQRKVLSLKGVINKMKNTQIFQLLSKVNANQTRTLALTIVATLHYQVHSLNTASKTMFSSRLYISLLKVSANFFDDHPYKLQHFFQN